MAKTGLKTDAWFLNAAVLQLISLHIFILLYLLQQLPKVKLRRQLHIIWPA